MTDRPTRSSGLPTAANVGYLAGWLPEPSPHFFGWNSRRSTHARAFPGAGRVNALKSREEMRGCFSSATKREDVRVRVLDILKRRDAKRG